MTKGNLISKQIPPAVEQQAIQLLTTFAALLKPYYSKVVSTDKWKFPIISEERLPFVTKAMSYIGTDPVYLPQDTDVVELNNDYGLFGDSRKIVIPLEQIHGAILNTNNLAGSDVYVTLLDYYMIVKRRAEQGDARAKVIYDDLKKLFISRNKRKTPPVA